MSENERAFSTHALSHDEWVDLLHNGAIELEGRMPWSSNATFLVSLSCGEASGRAVYKPLAGENPLWDFPEGLYRYEVAAYELSFGLGFSIVPETIERQDAPYGVGSLQRFVDADFNQHYFTMMEEPKYLPQLQIIVGLDLLLNNADRKGGHLLVDPNDDLFGIDNGLCFHPQPKLRTVMWDFAGEALPSRICEAAQRLVEHIPDRLAVLLSPIEIAALRYRARQIIEDPIFPEPDLEGRPYPWPRI